MEEIEMVASEGEHALDTEAVVVYPVVAWFGIMPMCSKNCSPDDYLMGMTVFQTREQAFDWVTGLRHCAHTQPLLSPVHGERIAGAEEETR